MFLYFCAVVGGEAVESGSKCSAEVLSGISKHRRDMPCLMGKVSFRRKLCYWHEFNVNANSVY